MNVVVFTIHQRLRQLLTLRRHRLLHMATVVAFYVEQLQGFFLGGDPTNCAQLAHRRSVIVWRRSFELTREHCLLLEALLPAQVS